MPWTQLDFKPSYHICQIQDTQLFYVPVKKEKKTANILRIIPISQIFKCEKKVVESKKYNYISTNYQGKNCANKYVRPTGLEIYLNEIFWFTFLLNMKVLDT